MRKFRYVAFLVFFLALLVSSCAPLRAQTELTLLSPNPITEPLNKLIATFESKTGIHVKVTYGTGVARDRLSPAVKPWMLLCCSLHFPTR